MALGQFGYFVMHAEQKQGRIGRSILDNVNMATQVRAFFPFSRAANVAMFCFSEFMW